MSEAYWMNVANYLNEADGYARHSMEDASAIPALDEAITEGIEGLRNVYGIDLSNPVEVYSLIVGFAVAYRYGCNRAVMSQDETFLRKHGNLSGHIGLVARHIAKNVGVDLPLVAE